jgi:outer membrane protein W
LNHNGHLKLKSYKGVSGLRAIRVEVSNTGKLKLITGYDFLDNLDKEEINVTPFTKAITNAITVVIMKEYKSIA